MMKSIKKKQEGPESGNGNKQWMQGHIPHKDEETKHKKEFLAAFMFDILKKSYYCCLTLLHNFCNRLPTDVSQVAENWKNGQACSHTGTYQERKIVTENMTSATCGTGRQDKCREMTALTPFPSWLYLATANESNINWLLLPVSLNTTTS